MDKKLNGFNNGRDTTDGVGGKETFIVYENPIDDIPEVYVAGNDSDIKEGISPSKTNLQFALEILFDALTKDTSEGSLYHAYQCNIAMAYLDNEKWYKDKTGKKTLNRKDKHEIANNAAKYFLDLLIKKE